MPDLGKYAGTVLGAYAATLLLLAVLVLLTWARGRAVRRRLEEAEAEAKEMRRG
ncbi:heme exporter protein CcmD [Kandeliimicrobium roseum]|uniref:heme exporter protein CcmD n=1 Tax=Oceaniglobus roseus TaxID=1737570 RepID=UPI000C7ED92E